MVLLGDCAGVVAEEPVVAEVLPLLYLYGLSSSDFGPALEQFLDSDQGLAAATIPRLTTQWQDEARVFNARSLAGTDYVYIWVDGIHLKVRLEADNVCLLVVIGGPRRRPLPGRRLQRVARRYAGSSPSAKVPGELGDSHARRVISCPTP